MKTATDKCKLMWNGKSNVEGLRFVVPTKNNALKLFVFGHLQNMRNCYVKRVKLAVSKFLTMKDFGLQ